VLFAGLFLKEFGLWLFWWFQNKPAARSPRELSGELRRGISLTSETSTIASKLH
jgi:hypothetical protein